MLTCSIFRTMIEPLVTNWHFQCEVFSMKMFCSFSVNLPRFGGSLLSSQWLEDRERQEDQKLKTSLSYVAILGLALVTQWVRSQSRYMRSWLKNKQTNKQTTTKTKNEMKQTKQQQQKQKKKQTKNQNNQQNQTNWSKRPESTVLLTWQEGHIFF